MDLEIQGKVAIITGGSRGIGLFTAMELAREGCNISICGRDENQLALAQNELEAAGAEVVSIRADVTDPGDAERLVEQTLDFLGRIDLLVNNVGGSSGGNLMDATDEDWVKTFELNLFQAIRMIRLVRPHIARCGGGSIVNIASISGWYPQLAKNAQYGSSKAALIFLTERLALELVADKIRVNTVSPGSIIWEHGGWDQFRRAYPEIFDAYVREGFPAGRLGNPREVAQVIAFLVSPKSNWINGRNIPVDGLEQPVPAAPSKPW